MHCRSCGRAGCWPNGRDAGDERSDLWQIKIKGGGGHGRLDRRTASATGYHSDRNTGVNEAFQVSGNCALSDVEFVRELAMSESGSASVQSLHEILLALDPPECGGRITGCRGYLPPGLDHASDHNVDIGVSWYQSSVASMDKHNIARRFFDTYARALLDRDAGAVAKHYAVPCLIEFPDQAIAVTDARQTEEFFAGAFVQYADVVAADATVAVVAETAHSIWADVSWNHHGGAPDERNMYQLAKHGNEWKIAVLTPLDA